MSNIIKELTTPQLKKACKSFYNELEVKESISNMASFNLTFEEIKLRLSTEQFEKFCVSL